MRRASRGRSGHTEGRREQSFRLANEFFGAISTVEDAPHLSRELNPPSFVDHDYRDLVQVFDLKVLDYVAIVGGLHQVDD